MVGFVISFERFVMCCERFASMVLFCRSWFRVIALRISDNDVCRVHP